LGIKLNGQYQLHVTAALRQAGALWPTIRNAPSGTEGCSCRARRE